MLDINNKQHISVIIKSLENIYNQAKIYGKLNPRDLNYLNIIYKLLNSCYLDLSLKDIQKLIEVYNKIEFNSEFICAPIIYPKHIQTKTTFVQAESKDCNNFPISNKIYYWEDFRLSSNITNLLKTEVLTTNYFIDKKFKTKSQFNTGVDIIYTETHKKCFMIFESVITDYIVYNLTTNTTITNDFDIVLIPTLNATLLVTNKDYSAETIKIQIT